MSSQSVSVENGEKETARVEAFSDGVFAIAITLLVLDIKVPSPHDLGGISLSEALLGEWPAYLSYVTSFVTVLVMWLNHHRLFTQIQKIDHWFLIINGMLLMVICVVPFSTSLVATYLTRPYAQTAAQVYSGLDVIIGFAFNLVWRHAYTGGRLLRADQDKRLTENIRKQYAPAPFLYVVAFLVAFYSAEASVAFCGLLAIFFALPPRSPKTLPRA